MYVKELWRYPVKSLRGEALASATVGESGIDGDRRVYVAARGRVITARTHPALLAVQATLDAGGEARIEGDPWDAPPSLDRIRAVAGPDAALLCAPIGAFDVLPLSVATDGAVASLAIDGRRLRPNLVIGGVDGLSERDWPGRRLLIGEVVIHVARLRPRCVMTTWDPDTQVQDSSVLRRIVHELDGTTALDCAVEQAGPIEVGATVRFA
jgi:uncharacterized protein